MKEQSDHLKQQAEQGIQSAKKQLQGLRQQRSVRDIEKIPLIRSVEETLKGQDTLKKGLDATKQGVDQVKNTAKNARQ